MSVSKLRLLRADPQFFEENAALSAVPRPTNLALILLTPTQPWVTPKRGADPISQ
jgi:hypothetical protein